ncbi:MAG: bifunctional riboflavin kinase/FMN adenylyltransferase [Maricaulis sp.]|jgi:riboflavin kinase/FMN adenylyltransferase|nr:bifunctional riboflavin kinase/FMN adenylyltransferase [Maricaulis sp.]HAQ34356.1 bifunctional riboflavin kinase/FMN adenylyltransferase [Alphaproteobacteria bacterium]
MDIVHGFSGLDASRKGGAFALGNFDGVHRGHQALLTLARTHAAEHAMAFCAIVFDPHPRDFFRPDGAPFHLMSDPRRATVLAAQGVERLHVLPFDTAMMNRDPGAFAREVLHDGLGVDAVFTGADFQFGKDRAGDIATLKELGEAYGFTAHAADLVAGEAGVISSTRIRDALAEGRVKDAEALLGRPWVIDGAVEEGDRRGRTIGFPTANIPLGRYQRPKFGVYAVSVQLDASGHWLAGVANVGVRPTVAGQEERLEVHLFDFNRDIYGRSVAVSFHAFLRPEQKFAGLDELKAQIGKDAEAARRILADTLTGPVS